MGPRVNFLSNQSSSPHRPIAHPYYGRDSKEKEERKRARNWRSKHGLHSICEAYTYHLVSDICSCLLLSWKASPLFSGFIHSRDFYRDELSKHGWLGPLHFRGWQGNKRRATAMSTLTILLPDVYAEEGEAGSTHSPCVFLRRGWGLPEGETLSFLNHYRKQKVTWLLFLRKNNSLHSLGIWAAGFNQTDNLGKLVCASRKSK